MTEPGPEMDLEAFRSSLSAAGPPAGISAPLRALWEEARGDWDAAHRTVQSSGGREAAWVHAYLHRKEGNESNAGHWYSRAGRLRAGGALEEEWSEIARTLLAEA